MTVQRTINICAERRQQLEMLSQQLGGIVPISELVDSIVGAAVLRAGLPDRLPGWDVEALIDRTDHFVHFAGPECPILHMSADEARQLADSLEQVACVFRAGRAVVRLVDGDGVVLARVGRGIRMVVRAMGGAEPGLCSITRSVARDLARQLRNAADKLEVI